MITRENIGEVLASVESSLKERPYVDRLRDPFKVLVATVISARTRDEVTESASRRLFERVRSPGDLLKLTEEEIAGLIYPAGFYRSKAGQLKKLARVLLEEYGGKVPDRLEDLVRLPGVGRKTANLVLVVAFGKDAIAVDTHVHRIMNRWGFVRTKKPEETEMALREKLPRKYWKTVNRILVEFGREICKPVNPLCSECPVKDLCEAHLYRRQLSGSGAARDRSLPGKTGGRRASR